MKTETKEYAVGDVMILRHKDGASKLRTVNIDRTTKKQIIVRHPQNEEDIIRFEKSTCGGYQIPYYHAEIGTRMKRSRQFSQWLLYDDSEGMMEALREIEKKETERIEEKAEIRDQKQREREELYAKEMAEVQEACGGPKAMSFIPVTPLKDGSRFYVVHMPVHSNHEERKKGFEVLIVRCMDVEDYDFEKGREWLEKEGLEKAGLNDVGEENYKTACMVKKVEFAFTYANGSTSSFSSVSTSKVGTDEQALWEAARMEYHSW